MFSDRENKIIKIIGKKTLTIAQIAERLWSKGQEPFDDNIAVSNCTRRIIKKCQVNKLEWTLGRHRENGSLHIKKERRA